MRGAFAVLFTATVLCAADRALPPVSTPGVINPEVTQANLQKTICDHRYAVKDGRKVSYSVAKRPSSEVTDKIKLQLMKQLHLPGKPSDYELDHRLDISGSGSPDDIRNLWMQPIAEARLKDRLEAFETRQLCSGKISLKDEQEIFLGDFWKEYDRLAPQQGWPIWGK